LVGQIIIVIFLTAALAVLIAIFYGLVTWARKQSKGATVAAAAMVGLGGGADPLLEQQLKVVAEHKRTAPEEDESGAPRK